ncbi:Uncharacterized protein OBRU01_26487, partial [Operophtera brumata]
IPYYTISELNEKLAKFVAEETKSFHNERDEKLLNQLKNSELNSEGIVKNWEKLFKDNVMDFAEQKGTSDEETFSEVRNSRDEDIKQLTQKQTDEMEEKVRQLNLTTTEEEINELATQHFEEQALVAGRWGSQLDALWQTQRAQYRAWLMSTLDEYQSTAALNTPSQLKQTHNIRIVAADLLELCALDNPDSQLKQTHNIRIVAADLLELCALDNPVSQLKQTHNIRIVAADLLEMCALDNPV